MFNLYLYLYLYKYDIELMFFSKTSVLYYIYCMTLLMLYDFINQPRLFQLYGKKYGVYLCIFHPGEKPLKFLFLRLTGHPVVPKKYIFS